MDNRSGATGGGPLTGIRVVDLSQIVSGPFATMILAEQGADVIKIESIVGGDMIRYVPITRGGMSSLYLNLNHGKRSVVVDVRSERGRGIVLDLMESADVVVQNFRPGVVDRLGIGYEAAAERRSDIVYVSVTGYGSSGPYASRPVYDPVIQALSGIIARQQSETIPLPDLVRNVMVDKATALNVAQAACAALVRRGLTGEGGPVEVSMLDTAVHFFWPDGMADHTFVGDGEVEPGPRVPDLYQITHTADGQLVYWAATFEHIHAILRVLGRSDLCADPRFCSVEAARVGNHREVLQAILVEEFGRVTTAEVLAGLHAADVPAGPVNGPTEVLDDPQLAHNGTFVEWEHPTCGALRQPRTPARFTGHEHGDRFVAALGQHTDEVLRELGRADADIATLRRDGVVA